MPSLPPPDPDALKRYAFNLFTKLEGAVTSGMVHLGDRLGLYRALADAAAAHGDPVSSAELAARAGLDERWVREWAYNQAAAGLIDIDDEEQLSLSAEALAVLVDESSPAFGMGQFSRFPGLMATLDEMPAAFRSGLGYDYDSHGEDGAAGIERSFEPWYRNYLLPVGLPALDGVVSRLEGGGTVADVGCGAGIAVCLMAAGFPSSQVHGYEISRLALERAEHRRADLGLGNAHFHDARAEPLPSDGSVDLVTTFDCIHDMTRPQEMMDAIRASLRDDGTWLLVDIKARDSYAENAAKNPMTALMYGISVLSCLSSALSEPGGAGLGTLGLPESRARAMAGAAGFTRFRR
ncbi:MAG TPA: class I SAM-dependent methyltransferase, partial [Acidimicrobiales bacterium]